MTEAIPNPQIAVLDTGGQYTHLIARKVRELGVYAEVLPSETPAARLRFHKGVIISGGPKSVYEEGSPQVDRELFETGVPVLGICYGQQLMARALGGVVQRGDRGEYGMATLRLRLPLGILAETNQTQRVWMSHRDSVLQPPAGFEVVASTETCEIAAIAAPERRLYGLQFHPEVKHTEAGARILRSFLFDVCECRPDWDPRHRVAAVEEQIRQTVGNRNVFFFVSGGVDSTVAYTLCLRALGPDRVSGFYVDTGFMREGETGYVRKLFHSIGSNSFMVEEAGDEFLAALEGITDPEQKRAVIGQQFVEVQERILRTGHFLEGDWMLGQGTIYPDTIESGGSAKADTIKTHHNRVLGIQKLMEQGRVIEPLASFYKDEVREIGSELAIPGEFLERHPFPGPGLAIRCLCSTVIQEPAELPEGWLIPVRSVGVQGDSRSYRHVLAISGANLHQRASELVNRLPDVNRVIAEIKSNVPVRYMRVAPATLTGQRLDRLRKADAIVRRISNATGWDNRVWQFPVVTIPFGSPDLPDSVVLRPVQSVDGMTAEAVEIDREVLEFMTAELFRVGGICAVFLDLTHKPPGTIEWE